jgi:hypothetical protein
MWVRIRSVTDGGIGKKPAFSTLAKRVMGAFLSLNMYAGAMWVDKVIE